MTYVFDEPAKKRLWREPQSLRSTDDLIEDWYRDCPSPHPLDQLQQVYVRSWLVEDLLMKADKMTMATSLELRVPFLDHALVQWAASAPLSQKVGDHRVGWSSKRVLREFARRRVPPEIVSRPKRGFPVPAYEWLSGPLAGWCRERLVEDESGGPLSQLFDAAAVKEVAQGAIGGDPGAQHRAWNLLILRQWLEVWQ
jgi:asparagine synthase (glutamine-hydrolysing)